MMLDELRTQMSGWAHGGPTSTIWHQVSEIDTVEGVRRARLLCDGSIVKLPDDEPYDYRWRPATDQQCRKDACRAEVEP